MKLGDTLRKAVSMQLLDVTSNVDEEIFGYLKPIFLAIANKWEKGCKLCFSNISEDTIQKVLDRIKAEDIVLLLPYDTFKEEDEWYVIWDSSVIRQKDALGSSPCNVCIVPPNFPLCSCQKKMEWLENQKHYSNYLYNEMERLDISLIDGKININYYINKENLWEEKENKKLGEVLQEAANCNLDEKIFEYLEQTFLSIANNSKKGCKLNFSSLCIDTIKKILERIEAEDIQVIESSLFMEKEKNTWYIIWDSSAVCSKTDILNSSPCNNCSAEIRMSCCGCPKYREWKEKNSTRSVYYHEEVELVDVAILGGNIYINRKLCYSRKEAE